MKKYTANEIRKHLYEVKAETGEWNFIRVAKEMGVSLDRVCRVAHSYSPVK